MVGDENQSNSGDVQPQPTAHELDELRRIKQVQEIKAELIAWAKQWATGITLVTAVLGLIGTNLIVVNVLRGFVEKDIQEAQKAAVLAEDASNRAKKSIDLTTVEARKYAEEVDKLRSQASEIDRQFKVLEKQIDAQADNVRTGTTRTLENLRKEVTNLENVVANLATSEAERERIDAELAKLSEFRKQSSEEWKLFEGNSEYRVNVIFAPPNPVAERLVALLRKTGFVVSEFNESPEFVREDWKLPESAALKALTLLTVKEQRDVSYDSKVTIIKVLLQSIPGVDSIENSESPLQGRNFRLIGVFVPNHN